MNFIKNYFFYQVSKEEKNNIRQKIMNEDHKAYYIILWLVFAFQLAMLVRSYIVYGVVGDEKPWIISYRYLYFGLALVCIFSILLSSYAFKKKKNFLYFVVVSLTMVAVQLWSVGITVLSSYNGIDLTTFSYVTIALAGFLTLEPWIASINMISVTVVLNILLMTSGDSASLYSTGVLINSLSLLAISILLATFNFYRRVKKLNVEFENVQLNQILERKAVIDDLTQLYNRTYLTSRLDDTLNIGEKPSAILMCDIDFFKQINDKYGHMVGDNVLQEVGGIILSFIKENEYAVRYGGEEFLVFFENISLDELSKRANELRSLVEKYQTKTSENLSITMSIGMAYAEKNMTYQDLIEFADSALYDAKKTRNAIHFGNKK